MNLCDFLWPLDLMNCRCSKLLLVAITLCVLASHAYAQQLNFSNHREVKPPEYALIRLGPFYSNVELSQSVGYRYSSSSGTGTDYLYNNRRGSIQEDGGEFPFLTTLLLRNYLIITRSIDLDISLRANYAHYPNGTQEDEFYLDLAEEGVFGSLSTEIGLSPDLKLFLYDDIAFRTDYVDVRGISDENGGAQYEHLENKLGATLDWMMGKDANLSSGVSWEKLVPTESDFSEQERSTLSENIAYEQRVSRFAAMGVRARFADNDYADTNRADSQAQEYTVFGNMAVSERTKGTFSVGYSDGTVDHSTGTSTNLTAETDNSMGVGHLGLHTISSPQLSYSLGYRRAQSIGFNSSFEASDQVGFSLKWQGRGLALDLSTDFRDVTPGGSAENAYSDWRNGIRFTVEPWQNVQVFIGSNYSVRDNEEPEGVVIEDDPVVATETTSDYDTLSTQLGMSLAVTKKVRFQAYMQTTERTGDSPDLDYERNTIAATFTFNHQF